MNQSINQSRYAASAASHWIEKTIAYADWNTRNASFVQWKCAFEILFRHHEFIGNSDSTSMSAYSTCGITVKLAFALCVSTFQIVGPDDQHLCLVHPPMHMAIRDL